MVNFLTILLLSKWSPYCSSDCGCVRSPCRCLWVPSSFSLSPSCPMRSCCCTPKVTTYSGSTPHSSSVRTLEHVLVSHYFFYLFITLHILWINEFRFEILNENNNNKSKCVWLKLEKITWQMRMSLFCFTCTWSVPFNPWKYVEFMCIIAL